MTLKKKIKEQKVKKTKINAIDLEAVDIMARTIWGEARGEKLHGQEAIAALLSHSAEIEKAAASVVLAEANGESWLQRN